MRQGFQKYSDVRQGYFLDLTCNMAMNKQQRRATLAFLKNDRRHGDPFEGMYEKCLAGLFPIL